LCDFKIKKLFDTKFNKKNKKEKKARVERNK